MGTQNYNFTYLEPNNNIDLVGDTTTFLDEIDTAIKGVENNSGKRSVALFIGNSYTSGIGSVTTEGIFALCKKAFDEAYVFTSSGQGFSTYSDHPHTFRDSLNQAAADQRFANEDVTHIFFISAMGDTRAMCEGYTTTVRNEMTNCANTIKSTFTNAIGYVAFAEMVYGRDTQSSYSVMYPLYQYYAHYIFNHQCSECGMVYMGWIGFNTNNIAGYNAADNYHPNDTGYKRLAGSFFSALHGVSPYDNQRQDIVMKNGTRIIATPIDPLTIAIELDSLKKTSFPSGLVSNTEYVIDYLMDNTFLANKLIVFPTRTNATYFRYGSAKEGLGSLMFKVVDTNKIALVFTPIGVDASASELSNNIYGQTAFIARSIIPL